MPQSDTTEGEPDRSIEWARDNRGRIDELAEGDGPLAPLARELGRRLDAMETDRDGGETEDR